MVIRAEILRRTLTPLKRLLLQLLLLFALYFLSRCIFTLINRSHFEGLNIADFLKLCVYALRFDLSALLAVNALYILLLFLPVPVWKMPFWERLTGIVFVLTNTLALLFELSDWAYFPYNFKRATADVLNMIGRKGDFWLLLPRFFVDYWFVPLGALSLGVALARFNRRICRMTPLVAPDAPVSYMRIVPLQLLLLVFVGGLSVIGIRGGLQLKPVNLRNALEVTESRYAPVVLNTPFSIINTFQNRALEPLHFYTENELRGYIQPVKDYSGSPFRAWNVVLIILESFSKEFTMLGAGASYTPFLDSLMGHSLVCTQAYANALRSAEGIPAIVSGLPSLMEEAITTSIYSTNRITALPNTLKRKGYTSAFYHGGTNGTMSFDIFCRAAGYDHYYGRREYGNEKDYDGNWGIRDEPFLQYAALGISRMRSPFFATIFTLSSHPPYDVPEPYKSTLPAGTLPVHQSIAYADMSLRKFFETAAQQPWYEHTLFVITADHCSPMSEHPYYQQDPGRYAIPIIYYAPGDTNLRGDYHPLTQQIDILPSVLDYLGYEQPFYALGNSIFRTDNDRFVINQVSDNYQWLSDGYLLKTHGTETAALYAFPADSSCRNNLLPEHQAVADEILLPRFRAFLQEYRAAMTGNRMSVD
jgi:hypothetical protein